MLPLDMSATESPEQQTIEERAIADKSVPDVVPAAIRGSRFASANERRSHLHRLHPVRLWRLLLGLGLLAFGIINIFIPGPGGSVLILSSLLILAGESSRLARALDALEVQFADQVDWALQHKLVAIVGGSLATFVGLSALTFIYLQLR